MRAELEVDGEVVAEEDVEAVDEQPVRAIEPRDEPASPILRSEVRTAAIAAAGGVLAGAVTVAAARAVGAAASRGRGRKSPRRRRDERQVNIVASRSFLVDVHVLGR